MNGEVHKIGFLKQRFKIKRVNYKMLINFLKKRKRNWNKNKGKTILEIFKRDRQRSKTARKSQRTMSMNYAESKECQRKSMNLYKRMLWNQKRRNKPSLQRNQSSKYKHKEFRRQVKSCKRKEQKSGKRKQSLMLIRNNQIKSAMISTQRGHCYRLNY